MAYISASDVALIRSALKKEFPKCRFSVRKSSGSLAVDVDILKGEIDFPMEKLEGHQVNPYWFESNYNEEQARFLGKIIEIIKTAPSNVWYDRSDSMTDYFETAFYYHVSIGQWKKPYVKV